MLLTEYHWSRTLTKEHMVQTSSQHGGCSLLCPEIYPYYTPAYLKDAHHQSRSKSSNEFSTQCTLKIRDFPTVVRYYFTATLQRDQFSLILEEL